MNRLLACNSPYGQGGIGQHFAQLVEEARRDDALSGYLCPAPRPDDALGRALPAPAWHRWAVQYTPVRFSPSWKNHLLNDLYDRTVAAALAGHDHRSFPDAFMGFVGKSLHSFHVAARNGTRLELIAANTHVDNVRRLHAEAAHITGITDTWLNEAQRRKTLQEYEDADVIYVHAESTRQSFLDAGIPASKLERTVLRVAPRFVPPPARPDDGVFRLVYVGRVDATKGVPLLVEAFRRLPISRAKLTIVGGWSTAAMRRFMEPHLHADPRITVAPGDPLSALQRADVFVHPSFEDGFGYAPMEALACGTPVIVTTDTGMQEYVRDSDNGFVVPTGDVDAIVSALQALHHHPLSRSSSLLPPTYVAALPGAPAVR